MFHWHGGTHLFFRLLYLQGSVVCSLVMILESFLVLFFILEMTSKLLIGRLFCREEEGSSDKINFTKILKTRTVRRGLVAGVGLQIFQQFVGINTVTYNSPTIVQLAGFASNRTALLLSLITADLNALGSIVNIYFVDRTGRKELLIISLTGVVISLALLSATSHETTAQSPQVSRQETAHFSGLTCLDYQSTTSAAWDCMKCLKASSPSCGFCASPTNKVPRCLRGVYLPLLTGSRALIAAQSFLSLTQAIGTSSTFLIFGVVSVVALFFVLICMPETKGLPIEEVEKMLDQRALQIRFWRKNSDDFQSKNLYQECHSKSF
ncbi:hypothetical protein NE237_001547 [Protea cynaroides]|uniref:Major facilitator superfamily (MFS) profile domain-containing protein n=1 Tax=Protea cynaroides TaxID=273540 RepID=A0A9Q0KU69_9MAGN|nr:hypothetical protein NE237_001547 [Protea cynaroides]